MAKIDELIKKLEVDAAQATVNKWEFPNCLLDDINDALTILRTITVLNKLDTLDKIKYVLEDYL